MEYCLWRDIKSWGSELKHIIKVSHFDTIDADWAFGGYVSVHIFAPSKGLKKVKWCPCRYDMTSPTWKLLPVPGMEYLYFAPGHQIIVSLFIGIKMTPSRRKLSDETSLSKFYAKSGNFDKTEHHFVWGTREQLLLNGIFDSIGVFRFCWSEINCMSEFRFESHKKLSIMNAKLSYWSRNGFGGFWKVRAPSFLTLWI